MKTPVLIAAICMAAALAACDKRPAAEAPAAGMSGAPASAPGMAPPPAYGSSK